MGDWSDNEESGKKPATDDWGDNGKTKDEGWPEEEKPRKSYNGDGRGRGGGRSFGEPRGGGGGGGRFNRESGDRGQGPRDRNSDENRGHEGSFRNRGGREGQSRENGDREPRQRREENGEETDEKRERYIPPEPTEDENEMYGTEITAGINFDKFDKIEIQVSESGQNIKPLRTFADAGLRDFLMTNIGKCGYSKPTPAQKYAIPIILEGHDVMGCAQTGSGKTAAYILPILNKILNDKEAPASMNGNILCLIIAPTRELVIQIHDEARKFSRESWVKVSMVYGGTVSSHQSSKVSNCHLLVATPGRLKDFVNKGFITFESLKFLVLDEADRMLDMGFRKDITEILENSTLVKENVQTLLFSATFPEEIQRLGANYLRDYIFFSVGIVGSASTDVEQEVIALQKKEKREKLKEILQGYENSVDDRILVFVETKKTADYLASIMSETTKLSSTSIHGDRKQSERELAIREFRSGKRKVLVATSVAARGLDIKGVTHVINYDMPKDIQEYVHRIGRTGRVGNRGKSTTFFNPEFDSEVAPDLARILKGAGQPVPDFLGEAATGEDGVFGGQDIRQGVEVGKAQEQVDNW